MSQPRNLMEVLSLLNSQPELLGTSYSYVPNSPLAKVFAYGYIPSYKWYLPEGTPPYNKVPSNHGESPRNLMLDIQRGYFRYFLDRSLPPYKRQKLFIHLIESLDDSDVAMVLAIKDQTLDKTFPNLTYEVLEKYHYVPHLDKKPEEETTKVEEVAKDTPKPKRGRGRPRKYPKVETGTKTDTGAKEGSTGSSKSNGGNQ